MHKQQLLDLTPVLVGGHRQLWAAKGTWKFWKEKAKQWVGGSIFFIRGKLGAECAVSLRPMNNMDCCLSGQSG